MDLTLLRSLVAVADQGSIGEAADALALSQPALSRRIQQLEGAWGVELVVRSGRGIVLTEMGRLAVREGRQLLERYQRLSKDVQRLARLEAGVVRVGAGATAVSYLLPRAIAHFQQQHAGVRFEVREAGSRDVQRGVLEDDVELGIVTAPVIAPELEVRPLLDDRIVLVAGAGHPLSGKASVDLEKLRGLGLIGFEGQSAIRKLIDDALRAAGVTMNVTMELRSVSAILRMVEATSSVAFVSELGAEPSQVVRVQGLSIRRQLVVVRRRQAALSPAAGSFLESLRLTAAQATC